jgi:phosphoglycolate phosphatase
MNKGLIIFDIDGTLGDTRRNIVTTMQMTIAELHLPNRSEEECAATIGLPNGSQCRSQNLWSDMG